jgi:antitoxin ParD1/3/4
MLERWHSEEVVSVYDAMKADPKRGVPADAAFAKVRARHAARLKASRREA